MNIFLLIPESIKSFLILIYSTMILFMLVNDSRLFSQPYSNLYLDRGKRYVAFSFALSRFVCHSSDTFHMMN